MSAASIPVPRSGSSSGSRSGSGSGSGSGSSSSGSSGSRHTLFWPMLVLLFGIGTFAILEVMALEDRWIEIASAIDKMDPQIKRAQYEKNKFYTIAKDVLRLAPRDPAADQVASDAGLKRLQADEPALLDLNTPSTPIETSAAPETSAATNSAPVESPDTTNAPPMPPGGTPAK